MIDCAKTRELLSPYLEGELGPDEGRNVGGHLDGCADCRAELELLRLTVGSLRETPELPAPAGILRGVREGLEPPTLRERARAIFFPVSARRLPLGAFASVLVAFGIFLIYDRYPEVGKAPVVAPPAEELSIREKEAPPSPTLYDSARPQPTVEPVPPSMPEPRADPRTGAETAPSGDRDRLAAGTADEDGEPAASAGAGEESEATARSDDSAAVMKYRQAVESPPAPEAAPVKPPPAPAPQPVRPPQTSPPTRPPPAPEPVTPAATQVTSGQKGASATVAGKKVQTAPPEGDSVVGRVLQEALSGAADERKQADWNRPQPAPAKGTSPFAAPLDGARSKSIPLRPGPGETSVTSFADDPASRESGGAPAAEERPNGYDGLTEVLTVVSLNGGEMDRLREDLRRSGGKMLEMRTLDAFTSQQLALPHQESIPPAQVISQGWQIRAVVPHSSVEEFVSAIGRDTSLQLLHRSTAPAAWSRQRGLQNIEINIVR